MPRAPGLLNRSATPAGIGDFTVGRFRRRRWPVTLLVTGMRGEAGRMIEDQLAAHERRIVSAARTGELVDLRVGDTKDDDPAGGAGWDGTRTVCAELLVELLTAERAAGTGRPRAIKVQGARITGLLDLEACELVCPLLLRGCHIDERVNLDDATAAVIRLPGCHLYGLSAEQLRTAGNLELNEVTTEGEINLGGAHIGGQLLLDGAHLINPGGSALIADGLTVDQSMLCRKGFTAQGEMRMPGAHIGGQFDLTGAWLINPRRDALTADWLRVGRRMPCGGGFTAEGRIRLSGAHIGVLSFNGAHLLNPRGYALEARALRVDLAMLCSEGFAAEGEVNLSGAQIGQLDLTGARLIGRNRNALTADGITTGSMLCGDGFTAKGQVSLFGAHIQGPLNFKGASLANPQGQALYLRGASVAHLDFRPSHRPEGKVDLTHARIIGFHDDQATWPAVLLLRGFTYETLENDQISVRDRLRWLTLHPGGYTSQIYDQLAAAYRHAGNAEAARKVGVAKQRRRRRVLSPLNWLLYLTVGYGYRTWLAGVWLAALTVIGAQVFTRAYPHYLIQATPKAPAFHAIAYTVDVLLPIVDLGQEKAWTPHGWALYWSWSLIAVGWVLTTAVVAGLTGIFKRD
jgi:hypothetical protein